MTTWETISLAVASYVAGAVVGWGFTEINWRQKQKKRDRP